MPIPGYGSGLAMPRSNSIVRVLIPMNDQGGALDFGLASADVEGIFNNYIPFRWVLEAPAPACRRLVGHYPQPGRGHPWAGSLNPGLLGHRPWGIPAEDGRPGGTYRGGHHSALCPSVPATSEGGSGVKPALHVVSAWSAEDHLVLWAASRRLRTR